MNTQQCIFNSPIGPLYLVASDKGLRGVFWKEQPGPVELQPSTQAAKYLKQTIEQLNQYFAGERQSFDIPLDIIGTDFQKKVWETLAQIPYGKTFSYKDIALKINNLKAIRAVGTANGRNPLSIIIPCHRVIGSDGKLTGYAGGLKNKAHLLQLEQR